MLTSVCQIVIKLIYAQNISTHVTEWPSILLHVVLMPINKCLRALYIMDNNVGALQTIPMGGATQNAAGEKRAEQPRPAGWALLGLSRRSAVQLCKWALEPAHWAQRVLWGSEVIGNGKGSGSFQEGGWGQETHSWTMTRCHTDGLGNFGQVT